jgi:CheY-like chemotaxis protein
MLQQIGLPINLCLKYHRYLTSRKAEWAQMEEEKLQNLPDPDCPIGHVMMPELERLETLSRLKQSMILLHYQLMSLFHKQHFLQVKLISMKSSIAFH